MCSYLGNNLLEVIMRPDWEQYYIGIAKEVATRSTCPRASVGAVIVKDNRIVSTGYNGAPSGEPHCMDAHCIIVDNHCQRAIHAETNAIAQAAKFGLSVSGATIYYWDSQHRISDSIDDLLGHCVKCGQLAIASGIIKVIGR
jgi:dCMP deaminase